MCVHLSVFAISLQVQCCHPKPPALTLAVCGLSADQNVHSTAQSPTNGIMGTHPIQAPCSVVDTYCRDIAEDTYKAHGGALTTLDFGVGEP